MLASNIGSVNGLGIIFTLHFSQSFFCITNDVVTCVFIIQRYEHVFCIVTHIFIYDDMKYLNLGFCFYSTNSWKFVFCVVCAGVVDAVYGCCVCMCV